MHRSHERWLSDVGRDGEAAQARGERGAGLSSNEVGRRCTEPKETQQTSEQKQGQCLGFDTKNQNFDFLTRS
jgi:hypothetical protein